MPNPIDTGAAGTRTTVAVDSTGAMNSPPARAVRTAATKKAPARKAPARGAANSYQQFATQVLRGIGAPVTAGNIHFILAWAHREGGGGAWNPLNTTLPYGSSSSLAGNSAGVQNYSSFKDGVAATIQTLQSNAYSDIRSAFATGHADPNGNYQGLSTWSGGGYSSLSGSDGSAWANQRVASSGASGGGAAGPAAASKPLSVKQYLDNPDVASQYGYLAAYLKDREVGPILAKAAKNGWGANQLLGALEKTKWWQNTSDSARQWQSQQRLDPASAHQRLGQMVGQVQQLAQTTLGAGLSPQRASQIANTALAQNWSQAQLQQAIGAEFHYNQKQTYGGLAGQTLDTLKQHADQYLVPISDQSLQKWTQGVLQGTYKDTDFDSYLKAQAQSLYPTLKTALDSGVTTRQYLDPYAQMAQQTLGVNPDGLNWMDPKWSKALNTTTPDGQRAPMSLSDWGTYLRGLPEYQYTDQAKQNAESFATKIAATFGKVM